MRRRCSASADQEGPSPVILSQHHLRSGSRPGALFRCYRRLQYEIDHGWTDADRVRQSFTQLSYLLKQIDGYSSDADLENNRLRQKISVLEERCSTASMNVRFLLEQRDGATSDSRLEQGTRTLEKKLRDLETENRELQQQLTAAGQLAATNQDTMNSWSDSLSTLLETYNHLCHQKNALEACEEVLLEEARAKANDDPP